MDSVLEKIAVWGIPALFAITLHEAAHGWAAKKLGDDTALLKGRITLNPIAHIDPIGTVLVPFIFLSFTPFIFGWAKPVPVNPLKLRRPKQDMALVGLAGPGSNFIMALGWALIMKLGIYLILQEVVANDILVLMGRAGILINLVLGVLNLIPIPPLDGSKVVASFLPNKLSLRYQYLEKVGFLLLIGLLISGVLNTWISPIIEFSFIQILNLYGISLKW